MLNKIAIRNFQSLKRVDLDLAPFTVIVGPSSSGKSALTRAIRVLTSNQRGDSFRTHGELTTTIQAETPRGVVVLTKGKPEDSYKLLPTGATEPKKYTKLGGDVPEEVSAFIGIPAKDPINYASQFDMPYLLKATASEVARVLGELTNVAPIFEAAREATRIRNQKASTLKTRSEDLQAILVKAQGYKKLREQQEALTQAEEDLTRLSLLNDRRERLISAMETTAIAQKHLQRVSAILEVPIPSDEQARAAYARYKKFATTLQDFKKNVVQRKNLQATIDKAVHEEVELEKQYTSLLVTAGTCPTCKQSTKELFHAH